MRLSLLLLFITLLTINTVKPLSSKAEIKKLKVFPDWLKNSLYSCQIPWVFNHQEKREQANLDLLPSKLEASITQNMAQYQTPEWARLVDIKTINPNIILDIRYATKNNFLNQKLYPVAKCVLRKEVAEKLSQVQADLETIGLGLKVYDCYRPLSVTKKMWEVLPDSRYVANPATGSRHNRGAAVDVTLTDLSTGKELEMPTEFDDFSAQAWRSYSGNKLEVQRNSELLNTKMKKYGFEPLITEWWHFDAVGWENFSILDVPLDQIPKPN